MQRLSITEQPAKKGDLSGLTSPLEPIACAIERVFPTKEREGRVEQTRRIMGTLVEKLADEELETYITEFQYLIDEWLDDFEKQAFDGKTLKQVIGQE